MNYYEHHLGDYARDTGHLSALEHGVYRLLLDRIYATEKGIPDGQQYRVAKASSATEKAAVDAVIGEFFILEDGCFWNRRARAEIEDYHADEPTREARRAAAKERQRRVRERRAALFEQARQRGLQLPWNVSMAELERVLGVTSHAPVTRDSQVTGVTSHAPETRLITASQSPISNPQSEDPPTPHTVGGAPAGAGGTKRANGTNPRARAEQEAERQRWTPLLDRAKRCGFRDPWPADTPESYETSLRLHERDHPPRAAGGAG